MHVVPHFYISNFPRYMDIVLVNTVKYCNYPAAAGFPLNLGVTIFIHFYATALFLTLIIIHTLLVHKTVSNWHRMDISNRSLNIMLWHIYQNWAERDRSMFLAADRFWLSSGTLVIMKYLVNPLTRFNYVIIVAVDGLAPCVARPSAPMIFIVK